MSVIPLADVVGGLCEWLATEGFGVYKVGEPYGPGDLAVSRYRLPTSPDRAVAVATYDTTDATVTPNQSVNVQLRFRAPTDVEANEWADNVADKLHWARQLKAGGLLVSRAERVLVAPLDLDDNGRFERADSYELVLNTE